MNEPKNLFWDEIRRLHRDAAMQCSPEQYSLYQLGALNAWPYAQPQPKQYPKNAIGIPLIRTALGEKE